LLKRLSVMRFQDRLAAEAETRPTISNEDFLALCRSTGTASSDEEAARICAVLADAGIVLRFADLVYLRPMDIAEYIVQALPGSQAEVQERLDALKQELSPMDLRKQQIDRTAHRWVSTLLWAGLASFVFQWLLFLRLTFWELSWDVMEPVCYFVSSAGGIAAYCYFLATHEDFGYAPWRSRIAQNLQNGGYARRGGGLSIVYSWVYESSGLHDTSWQLKYSHMGMLGVLPNGSIAALWQAAPVFWEGSQQQGIYWAISDSAGLHWNAPELLVRPSEALPIWAPVLQVQKGIIWLYWAESRAACTWYGEGGLHHACGGDLFVQTSGDSGITWSDPKMLLSYDTEGGIAKMVSNKPAVSPEGHWLLPFWREMGGNNCTHSPGMHGKPGLLISSDQGQTWNVVNSSSLSPGQSTWLIEPAIAGTVSGWLQVFRTTTGSLYQSQSADGLSWSNATESMLPNPNSKVDMIALEDTGMLLLAFNDATDSRSLLTLAASWDGGTHWTRVALLEDDSAGSFSYPTLLDLPAQDLVLVIYSVDFFPAATNCGLLHNA
ncbi:hypothetical protein WJX73_005306, partial [Symbiochloris irregularis]